MSLPRLAAPHVARSTTRKTCFPLLAGLAVLAACSLAAHAQPMIGGDHIPAFIDTPLHYAGVSGRGAESTWHYTLSHPGATYIALHFAEFDLAEGDYLIVTDPAGLQTYTLEGRGKMQAGTFWARHIKGDTVLLELVQTSPKGGFGFVIDEYVAGFLDVGEPTPRAICGADDKKNAKCYELSHPTEYNKARAIARLLSNGSAFCTGWLVSPQGHLLTNEHCISSATSALNTDYEFMSEAPTCASANCSECYPGTIFDGGVFIKDDANLDYCLIQVNGNPATTYGFLELDNRTAVVGEQIYVVQHPGGRAKEIGYASSHPSDTGGLCRVISITSAPCTGSGYNDVGYYCDTEPGSSGSAVLASSTHKVIALHHCANCPNRGVPINRIYPHIAQYLLPSPAGMVTFDRGKYACADELAIEVRDGSLQGAGSIVVEVAAAGGDLETVTLTETGSLTAIFAGTLALSGEAIVTTNGVLEALEGEVLTVSYLDADDGAGGNNLLRTDTAVVDCTPPVIGAVTAINIEPHTATIHIPADEPVLGTVHYGPSCAALNSTQTGTALGNPAEVNLAGLPDAASHFYTVEVRDEAGNGSTADNGGACFAFVTPEIQDFYTELFTSGNDLDNLSLTFTPDGSIDFYSACAEPITQLPTDPAGGTPLSMSSSDTYATINLPAGVSVSLYGVNYTRLYPNSDGYITFTAGVVDYSESLADHFNRVQIAALFDDLNPGSSGGGTVSWKLLEDRVAVTWQNVPEHTNIGSNTFQIEMHFDGTIVLSYLNLSADDGLAGLSAGTGLSPDFEPNDLSALGACGPKPPRALPGAITAYQNQPASVTLIGADDGLPDPPAALSYIITSLPANGLVDPGTGAFITPEDLPYTLVNGGNEVIYQGAWGAVGSDSFRFKVNDGGVAPEGGDSNEALIAVTLTPRPPQLIYSWNFDVDPGWARDSQWAFGTPGGGGTRNRDPLSGYTGSNVFGYNLFGDYTINLSPRYLTTDPIDCTKLSNTSLRFRRWLGVESYDEAAIEASYDGVYWHLVWENPSGAGQSVADTSWVEVAYDVAVHADRASEVRFRWRMGPTDGFTNYPGWNIDDVEIWAMPDLNFGDYDGDGKINLVDHGYMDRCLTGPGGKTPVGCEGFDSNGDGDVDLQDFAALQCVMEH